MADSAPAIHGLPATELDEGLTPIKAFAVIECLNIETGETYLQISVSEGLDDYDSFTLAHYGAVECHDTLNDVILEERDD